MWTRTRDRDSDGNADSNGTANVTATANTTARMFAPPPPPQLSRPEIDARKAGARRSGRAAHAASRSRDEDRLRPDADADARKSPGRKRFLFHWRERGSGAAAPVPVPAVPTSGALDAPAQRGPVLPQHPQSQHPGDRAASRAKTGKPKTLSEAFGSFASFAESPRPAPSPPPRPAVAAEPSTPSTSTWSAAPIVAPAPRYAPSAPSAARLEPASPPVAVAAPSPPPAKPAPAPAAPPSTLFHLPLRPSTPPRRPVPPTPTRADADADTRPRRRTTGPGGPGGPAPRIPAKSPRRRRPDPDPLPLPPQCVSADPFLDYTLSGDASAPLPAVVPRPRSRSRTPSPKSPAPPIPARSSHARTPRERASKVEKTGPTTSHHRSTAATTSSPPSPRTRRATDSALPRAPRPASASPARPSSSRAARKTESLTDLVAAGAEPTPRFLARRDQRARVGAADAGVASGAGGAGGARLPPLALAPHHPLPPPHAKSLPQTPAGWARSPTELLDLRRARPVPGKRRRSRGAAGKGDADASSRLLVPLANASTATASTASTATATAPPTDRLSAIPEDNAPGPARPASPPCATQLTLRGGSIITLDPPEASAWSRPRPRYLPGAIRLAAAAPLPRTASLASLDAFQGAVERVYQHALARPRRRSDDAAVEEACVAFGGVWDRRLEGWGVLGGFCGEKGERAPGGEGRGRRDSGTLPALTAELRAL